jgi:hypothetical protein
LDPASQFACGIRDIYAYNTAHCTKKRLQLCVFFSGKGEKIVQNLTADGKVIQINRPCDKRKVLFYYDHSTDFEVDEEFIKQVRFTP